mgnify:CR=1 FL=1
MLVLVDLSNLVEVIILNDGRPNVDKRLEQDLLSNKSQILKNGCLIDFSTESNYYLKGTKDEHDIFTSIHTILDNVGIPADLVHFCTGNLLNKQNYNTYTGLKTAEDSNFLPFKSAFYKDFWCTQTLAMHKDYSINYTKTNKPKYFSCLNGRERDHRAYTKAYLERHNLLDKGVCTFVWQGVSVDGYTTPEDITSHTVQPDNFYKVFDDTYYDVITETLTGEESNYIGIRHRGGYKWWQEVFITEKTWRSIYYKRPFMVIGNKHTLKTLQELGFKTFNNILFDESYDEIDDWQMRTYAVLEQNKYIVDTYSLQDLENIVRSPEMNEILEYNYNKINNIAEHNS